MTTTVATNTGTRVYHTSLKQMLQTQPPKGRGHTWLFRVAIHLRHYHTEEACFRLLRACANEWRDRSVPDGEIRAAVSNAYAATPRGEVRPAATRWPDPNPRAIERVLRTTAPSFGLDPIAVTAQQILPTLFSLDELLCIGFEQARGSVATLREILQSACRYQFIVPSPMTAHTGRNQQGLETFRCLANTGTRRWLVIENDSATKEEQAKILTHLSELLPLVLVVDSAGKSLHGWFRATGTSEPDLRLFMQYATHLGSDPHTWNRCQWVRMPGGIRTASGFAARPQSIIYAQPGLLKGI